MEGALTMRDKIDALLAQSKAAPQDKPNPTTGQDGPAVPASAAPDSGEGMPSIHDRIIRCVEQAGHPDWSLKEMMETLKHIAIDSRHALSLRERENQYPDTEADGIVFCGKCGVRR